MTGTARRRLPLQIWAAHQASLRILRYSEASRRAQTVSPLPSRPAFCYHAPEVVNMPDTKQRWDGRTGSDNPETGPQSVGWIWPPSSDGEQRACGSSR